jgi:predicted ATPase with chaperone activity
MLRVHVNLSPSLLSDQQTLRSVAMNIVTQADMKEVNYDRLYKYAVLTGTVRSDEVKSIRKLDGVSAVSADEIRYAAS